MHRFRIGIMAIGLMASTAWPALAADDAVLKEIQALKSRLADLEKRLEKKETVAKASADKPKEGDEVIVSLKPRPTLKTADGSTSFSLDGRLVTDAGFVTRDGGADLADATDVRYLRLGVGGTIDDVWKYRMQVAFENDSAAIKDAYLAYTGFENVNVQVGHYKEFSGIDDVSSSLNPTFMERSSAATTLGTADRHVGFSVQPYGEDWGAQLGIFGDGAGDNGTDDEGYSLSARAHRAFMRSDDRYLHVGAHARYRVPDASMDSVRFRSRGESHVIGERLVDTGSISGVDYYTTLGAEARYQHGPVALMGEYFLTDVERETAADPTFDGGYVSLSWFLTGEQRSYDSKKGTYGRLKPSEPFEGVGTGKGAWELATRYSWVDLNDAGVTGGTLDAYTFGANWYPTAWTRFMLNYVMNDVDGNAAFPNADPHYVMLRAQVDF